MKDFFTESGFSLFTMMIFLLGSVLLAPGMVRGETIFFPLKLDYPFLETLLIHATFTDPNQTLVVTDPDNDCQKITLSNPSLGSENNLLRIEAAVHMKGGTRIGESCILPVEWDGYLVAHMKPRISSGNWLLSFEPVDSVLLDKSHRPNSLMGHLWKLFEGPVMASMGQIHIGVNEPIEQLTPFLLSSMPEADHPDLKAMLESFRPGAVVAEPEGLTIKILADIETMPTTGEPPVPAPLSPSEIEAFVEIWETWDSFLVQTLMSLQGMPLTDEERETLLTVLLDTRYRFVAELEAHAPSSPRDFVREQFVDAWEKLSPILKSRLSRQPSSNSWGYLAFFAASDVLTALDKLGPAVNIEISRNGLIRLARMLSENKALILQYNMLVDPDLRKLLGMEPPPEFIGPAFDERLLEREDPETKIPPASMTVPRVIISGIYKAMTPGMCWAEKPGLSPSLSDLKQWLVTRDNVENHIPKIKAVLEAATKKNVMENSIPESYFRMVQETVYATAWQESCFRQFIVENRKLTYLLSYTKTSVGMMQVNERVWRGMYDIEHLRWDIRYNAAAGVDILNMYLKKYALPKKKTLKGKEALDNDGLACALYAMYNAGPGGFSAYVKSRSTGNFSEIANHFRKKYFWVKTGRWERLRDCFF